MRELKDQQLLFSPSKWLYHGLRGHSRWSQQWNQLSRRRQNLASGACTGCIRYAWVNLQVQQHDNTKEASASVSKFTMIHIQLCVGACLFENPDYLRANVTKLCVGGIDVLTFE
jgi:hypothetical protein